MKREREKSEGEQQKRKNGRGARERRATASPRSLKVPTSWAANMAGYLTTPILPEERETPDLARPDLRAARKTGGGAGHVGASVERSSSEREPSRQRRGVLATCASQEVRSGRTEAESDLQASQSTETKQKSPCAEKTSSSAPQRHPNFAQSISASNTRLPSNSEQRLASPPCPGTCSTLAIGIAEARRECRERERIDDELVALMDRRLWRREVLDVLLDPARAFVGHVIELEVALVVLRETWSARQPSQRERCPGSGGSAP